MPGSDGRKMSKSYGNTIEMFAPEKALRKQVMGIVTDSKGVDEPKDPDTLDDLRALLAARESRGARGAGRRRSAAAAPATAT